MNAKIKIFFSILFIIIVAVIVMCVTSILYNSDYIEDAKRGKRNVERSKMITLGMTRKQVVAIMGVPDDTLISPGSFYSYAFMYLANVDSYPYVQINFTTGATDTVTSVISPISSK